MSDNNLKIEFWTEVPGLSTISELRPKKMTHFTPDWWKKAPYELHSVKTCPSFADIFSSTYVIPMWCDSEFSMKDGIFYWKTASNKFQYMFHSSDQFEKFLSEKEKKNISAIIKAISPWRIKTPPGYSVYEMPLFWHLNDSFSIAPGIVHTDFMHQSNQQILLNIKEGESVLIERGQPFVCYFPFKRQVFDLEVREKTESDALNEHKSDLIRETKFSGGYKKFLRGIEND